MASTYPAWIFDGSPIDDPFGYGERAVKFLRALKHPSSTAPKNALQLADWQERIVRRIYGPRHPDGSMIVKTVLLLLPRGNRKTSLAAALALLHTIGPEAVPKGQAIFAAKDRDQGKIAFEEARDIIRMDNRLVAATRIYDAKNSKKLIECDLKQSRLEVLSSDGGKAHGLSPTFVLMDELHAWKGRELWAALKSARPKRSPLTVICTTAGSGQENLLWDEYDNACRIAEGKKVVPSYLPILFMTEPGDDWQDEAVWHKANPGLKDGFISIDELRDLALDAQDRPQARYDFQQLNLNMWQAASRSPLFDMGVYDEGQGDLDLADLADLPCFIGVDMSVNGDLTAVVAAWRHDDGRISVHPWFFVPGDDLKGRSERDRAPYEQWRDEGYVIAVDGPVIDPETVEAHIRELCAANDNVQEIAFDPHLARMTMQRLYDDGLPAIEMRQGPLTMGPAIGTLERIVNGRMLRHGGHPVLRHHFDSVVASRNDTGLVRMHKGRNTDRIDGAVAAAMAVARAAMNDNRRSFLDMDPDELDRLWSEAA